MSWRTTNTLVGGAVLFALLLPTAGGCRGRAAGAGRSDKMIVMASIAPLAYFSRRVGGERAQVEMLVPPGASPHTFEPKPADLKLLAQASLLVLNGIGLEFWADSVVRAAHNPDLRVVKTSEGLEILHPPGGAHGEAGNPHVWLDPIDASHQVQAIASAFAAADPAGAQLYRRNADALVKDLHSLDAEIRATVATFQSKAFVSQHAAWVYFARRYGLEEAAVVETTPGREPSPREIAGIVDTVRRSGARAVFAEPQLSQKAAEVIAAETGARVLLVNPLGIPPDYDYLKTMRYNLAQMKEGLG